MGLFVDWNSQIRLVPEEFAGDASSRSKYAIRAVGKTVAKAICRWDEGSFFRVRIRLYHGWTAGITNTENRRAIARLAEYEMPDEIFPSARVLSLGDIEFGDRLIDALSHRENTGLGIHLPGTMRRQDGRSPPVEKMVDTALAADLLSWARAQPESLAIVISSDDDLWPPIFVAESWMKPHGGEVKLIRPCFRTENRFLQLEGLFF